MTSDTGVGNTQRAFKRVRWRFLQRRIWLETDQEAGFISNACWASLTALGTFLKEGRALRRSVRWQVRGKVIFDSSKDTAVPRPL